MRKLATTAATLATIVAVCFATLQLAGRALCWQLPALEGTVNRLLASRGVAVYGIEGRWHGLDAGFFAERVYLPAGELHGLDFELDLLESLARNRVVARRFTVADGHLAFEKTADGWRLRGSTGPNTGDAAALFLHSDEVWLRGRLLARDGGQQAAMHVEAMLINRDREHQFHVAIQAEPNCQDCALTVDGRVHEDGPGMAHATATRFALGRELATILGVPVAAPDALGATAPTLFAVRGDWRRDLLGRAKAKLDIAADIPALPRSVPARLSAALAAWSEAGGYRGRIVELAAASGAAEARLADGGFRFATNTGNGATAELWLPPVDIAAWAAPVAEFLGDERESGKWLRRLAPGGQIRDFVLRADAAGLAFRGTGANGSLAGYKGVPKLADALFAFGGHGRALRIRVEGEPLLLTFPNFFPNQEPFERAGGVLTYAFSPGHLGLRCTGAWGEQDGARVSGGFAWSRPRDPLEARVSADFAFDQAHLALARAYLPLTLRPKLRRWLLDGVRAGRFQDGRLIYHGLVKTAPGDRGAAGPRSAENRALRRTELAARVLGGTLDYHADWPRASDIDGRLVLTHDSIRLRGRARAFDTALADVQVRTPRTGDYTHVRFAASAPAPRVLRFARTTPTRDALPFLADEWSATGQVDFRADLTVPLRGQAPRPGDIRLDMHLRDAVVDLADLGLRFEGLQGHAAFASPHALTTPDGALRGSLFGAPARVAFATDADSVRVRTTGTATTADALGLLNAGNLDLVAGKAPFDATLAVFPNTTRAPELTIESDLQGVAVTLPPPLGKTSDQTLPARVVMHFLDDHIAASVGYGAADGWLQVRDGEVAAGAVGIGAPIPMVDAARGRVVIAGELKDLDAHTVAALMAAPAAEGPGFAWELRKFHVGELALESARLHNVVLDGYADDGDLRFDVLGQEVEGVATKTADAPWRLRFNVLRLPALNDDGHRLSPEVIDRLVDADVAIDEVRIGDVSYGKWRFGLRRQPDGVLLTGIDAANVRGLDIVGSAPAFWSQSGETSFAGTVSSGDVRAALAAWDFAPSVQAERFEATGELRWPGSPFDFALAHVTGNAALRLDNGRFLEVEPGGARIMSLINFSEILRRMRLDFSDVFGRGSDFDRVRAELVADDGLAHFAQPARITGSAASFRIGGTVNLDTGALDNEMIVTVTLLHRNLPWYAAFLAFSNPASAAGVLLGSQVLFKDQIKQFSSGKYTIGGTYEDPDVRFVGIWRDDIATPTLPGADANPPPPAVARREGGE